ncbi:MAG TPA: universal stress protein [Gemmatimonadales bacterium]|nr:universal stress protein [Gemmatimonadales bacterium]
MEAKPVVVGVDGSEESKRALRWAARYAEQAAAPLHPLLAWEEPTNYGWPTYYDDVDFQEKAREKLNEVVREVLGDLPTGFTVQHGHAAAALIDASKRAGLLVVGQRGHGEFHDRLLGSVSQHCVHHAHCPVVVVRGD